MIESIAPHPAVPVSSAPRPTRRAERRVVPVRRTAARPIRAALALGIVEAFLPTVLLVGVMAGANVGAMPDQLGDFMELRVTVKNVMLCVAYIAACGAVFLACRLYEARAVRRRSSELARVALASTVCAALGVVFPLTSVSGGARFVHLAYLWALVLPAGLALRGGRRLWERRHRQAAPPRVIVAGVDAGALRSWSEVTVEHDTAYELIGYVDAPLPSAHRESAEAAETVDAVAAVDARRLGSIDELERLLMQRSVDEVFIALPLRTHYREFEHVIAVCERGGVRTKFAADLFPTTVAWPGFEPGARSVLTMHVAPHDYRLVLKRALDVTCASCALIVLSPVLIAAAMAVKLTSPGPVLFVQERCGLNKRRFRMLKFRTMVANAAALQSSLESLNEADGPVFKINHDPRTTPFGGFLRKTSIDELPQLFNVLKGEMSLVGPRPLPIRDVQRFRRGTDMRRFSVLPGLTCLWQVSGRSELGFGEWVQLDLQYIDGWSLAEDLRILVRTIPAVLKGTGAV
jgi:exopolysaccharide biosynthesis polyprenyl glycosylphosphotransferase